MLHLSRRFLGSLSLLASVALIGGGSLGAQWLSGAQTPRHARTASAIDSGYLGNPTGAPKVVFSTTVTLAAGTTWAQFVFHDHSNLPEGSVLRLTSTKDGAVQRHTGLSLKTWGHHSAYLNGAQFKLELIAAPKSVGNRLRLREVIRGLVEKAPSTDSICGVDNRVLSSDKRQGRLWLGCTGWLIGPNNGGTKDLMLSAGHCTTSGTHILELNVPSSTAGGSLVRSHPDDQYPYVVLNGISGSVGADWLVAHVGANSNTGKLPTQANGGVWYQLGPVPGSTSGQNITITGYGTNDPRTARNQVQTTHTGPLASAGSSLCYQTDTTGGNSGSPVLHANSGNAIGIHTHGGCTASGGGCNSGTRIDRSDLQAAIQAARKQAGTFEIFGTGCAGTGTLTCPELNRNGGALSNDTRTNEYAYVATAGQALTVQGFSVFSASTGGNVTVNTAIYADVNGAPSSTPLATGTMVIGATPGFYSTSIAAKIPAGRFYLSVDHSAQNTYVVQLNSGSAGTAFWRRTGTAFALSQLITRPAFRVQCTASGVVPRIGHAGLPVINQSFAVTLDQGRANASAVLLLGLSDKTWSGGNLPLALDILGAPGCQLLVSPLVPTGVTLDGSGSASLPVNVPNLPAYVGVQAFFQWYVIDSGANFLQVATSAGAAATVGG